MEWKDKTIERLQKNLSLIRQLVGWKATEVALHIGVSRQSISNIERLRSKMTLIQYKAIMSMIEEKMNEEGFREILPGLYGTIIQGDFTESEEKNITDILYEAVEDKKEGKSFREIALEAEARSKVCGLRNPVLGANHKMSPPNIPQLKASDYPLYMLPATLYGLYGDNNSNGALIVMATLRELNKFLFEYKRISYETYFKKLTIKDLPNLLVEMSGGVEQMPVLFKQLLCDIVLMYEDLVPWVAANIWIN